MWWWGGREWEHTRRTKPLSKGGKETWISTFMPAYYSEGLSASLQIFCWLCVKIRSYYLPTQLNLAEARRLRKEGPWVKCEAVVSMGNEFILN